VSWGEADDSIPEVSRIVAVCGVITTDRDTGVDAGGIGVPDINPNIRDRLAGSDVDVLDLKVEINTITVQVFFDDTTDLFSSDVVGTVCDLWSQDTTGVGREDRSFKGRDITVYQVSLIVVHGFELFEGSQVTPD
jgi:hypothetical protein